MGFLNSEIEDKLSQLPEKIKDAEIAWDMAKLEREKSEALLHVNFKGQDPNRTATDIKHLTNLDPGRHEAVIKEILAKAQYNFLYESLMCAKKKSDLRTAF